MLVLVRSGLLHDIFQETPNSMHIVRETVEACCTKMQQVKHVRARYIDDFG